MVTLDMKQRFLEKLNQEGLNKASFCKKFGLNRTNFVRWFNEKRECPGIDAIVLDYINAISIPQHKNTIITVLMKIIRDDPEFIVFIDADNRVKILDEFIEANVQNKLHAVCFVNLVHGRNIRIELQASPWITFIPSQRNVKNASDISLCMDATLLHTHLSENAIPFVIVSGDHFILECVAKLESYGRIAYAFNPAERNILEFLSEIGLIEEC